MSMRLALLSDGLLGLAHRKGLITENQVNATLALSGAYHTRFKWAPTAARLIGRAAGYGSKSTSVLSPGAARIIASHPGTISRSISLGTVARAGMRYIPIVAAFAFFATLEQPGTQSGPGYS